MTSQTNEQLLASRNSWASLCKKFDNQRMALQWLNRDAIRILSSIENPASVHAELPKLLESMNEVLSSNPHNMPSNYPPAFKGHGKLLDDLIESVYMCSQLPVGTTEVVLFLDAVEAVKETMTKHGMDVLEKTNTPNSS